MGGIHQLDHSTDESAVDDGQMLILDGVAVVGNGPEAVTDDRGSECLWTGGYFVAKQRNSFLDSFVFRDGRAPAEIADGTAYFVAAVDLIGDAVDTQQLLHSVLLENDVSVGGVIDG